MTETVDDARLRATEAQMRHALGLDAPTPSPSPAEHPAPSAPSADRLSLHRPPRRFVKDGEVQVTTVRRTHPTDAASSLGVTAHSQLESARQTIRSQAVTIERSERALADAQTAIRDLRTKLGHERLAKDEALQAVRRAETERDAALAAAQALRTDVATERVGRERVEQELQRLRDARDAAKRPVVDGVPRRRGRPPKVRPPELVVPQVAAEAAEEVVAVVPVPKKRGRPRKIVVESAEPIVPRKRGRPRKVAVEKNETAPAPRPRGRPRKVPVVAQTELGLPVEQAPRRRGRPPKAAREPQPVKWWAKGWKTSGG